jgi:hypothetical protein
MNQATNRPSCPLKAGKPNPLCTDRCKWWDKGEQACEVTLIRRTLEGVSYDLTLLTTTQGGER